VNDVPLDKQIGLIMREVRDVERAVEIDVRDGR
jgi:hypothetical protein